MILPAITSLTPSALADVTWEELRPLYQELIDRPVDAGSVEAWLSDWSRLEEVVSEAAALAMIAYTCDTTDSGQGGGPPAVLHRDPAPDRGARRSSSPSGCWRWGTRRPGLEVTIARFRRDTELFREANVPLSTEVGGAQLPLSEDHRRPDRHLGRGREDAPRAAADACRAPTGPIRERAFRLGCAGVRSSSGGAGGIFDSAAIASGCGWRATPASPTSRPYAFAAKCRFDYTPADCRRFHEAVERYVTPAVERLIGAARKRMRLDVGAAPLGRRRRPAGRGADPALHRGRGADRDQPPGAAIGSRRRWASEFRDHGRRGAARSRHRGRARRPGGYCETLHAPGPAVHLHERGRRGWTTSRPCCTRRGTPFTPSRRTPSRWSGSGSPGLETCELASMSMELLAAPYLGTRPGRLLHAARNWPGPGPSISRTS